MGYLGYFAARMLYAAGVDPHPLGAAALLGFLLFGFPALTWFPVAFLYGVGKLCTRREWRRSWYGWLWPPLVYADLGLFLAVVDHGPI